MPGSMTFCSQVNEHLCNCGGKAQVRSVVPLGMVATYLVSCDNPL